MESRSSCSQTYRRRVDCSVPSASITFITCTQQSFSILVSVLQRGPLAGECPRIERKKKIKPRIAKKKKKSSNLRSRLPNYCRFKLHGRPVHSVAAQIKNASPPCLDSGEQRARNRRPFATTLRYFFQYLYFVFFFFFYGEKQTHD